MSAPAIARHLMISGRVQGVGYRWSMVGEARRLGLGGWVRNRSDGHVEALVCGDEMAVLTLILWARQGPPGARVDNVLVTPSDESHSEFVQRPNE